jgi:hypothetical protein
VGLILCPKRPTECSNGYLSSEVKILSRIRSSVVYKLNDDYYDNDYDEDNDDEGGQVVFIPVRTCKGNYFFGQLFATDFCYTFSCLLGFSVFRFCEVAGYIYSFHLT